MNSGEELDRRAPMDVMELKPVTYGGRLAAVCSPDRVYFAEWIEILELDHPTRRFVGAMCLHAGDVFNELATAPSTDGEARRCTRVRLVPPAELLACSAAATDAELSEHFNVPLDEVRLARRRQTPSEATKRW